MYAVIRTGGKQYRVAPDDILEIEKIEAAEGEVIELPEVLIIGKDGGEPQVGTPVIDGARVAAEVLEQGRGEKIIVFKKKRRKNYRRKRGHRQHLTTIRVLEVLEAGQKAKKKPGEGTGKKAKAKPKEEPGEGFVGEAPKEAKGKAEKAEAKAETGKGKKKAASKEAAGGFQKLDAPQGEPDNLKTLPGVGPKLAEKLNEYGIFHFHQLAAMSEADLEEMDAALNLRGRATRDDWVGQAKQMIEGEND
jgi:large subunit ribosomal protein L21